MWVAAVLVVFYFTEKLAALALIGAAPLFSWPFMQRRDPERPA